MLFHNGSVLHEINELCLIERKAATGFADSHLRGQNIVCLMKDVGEEGVRCMIGREILLKYEELIDIVECPVEE